MFHSYDYISLFVPFFDIPVSLGSLFQRIASINDRFYLSRLNSLLICKVIGFHDEYPTKLLLAL